MVLTSVARISPLRSRRSGRAPETASSAAPFSVCGGSCERPSTTSFTPMRGIGDEHAERDGADARARPVEPRRRSACAKAFEVAAVISERRVGCGAARRRLQIDAEILRHVAAEERDHRARQASHAPRPPCGARTCVVRRLRHGHLNGGVAPPATVPGGRGGVVLHEAEQFQRAADRIDLGLWLRAARRPLRSGQSASGCMPSFESASACSRSGRARWAYSARRRLMASFSLAMRWRVFTSCSEA